MIVFVLHGFASATPNAKFDAIKEHFKQETVIGLNYEFDQQKAMEHLDKVIDDTIVSLDDPEVVFIGTSLGGLLAEYYAYHFNGKAIKINPCIEPEKTLLRYVGDNVNYKTNKAFSFSKQQALEFANFKIEPGKVNNLTLLDKGDTVIDPEHTINVYNDHAQVVQFNGGSHRFEHLDESFVYIDQFVNTFNNN